MITFLDVKQSSIVNVAGKCADSTEFAQIINEATRRLLRRGDWVGTVTPIQVCSRRGCFVMPRYVQSIRNLALCGEPLPVGNLWYRFITAEGCRGFQLGSSWMHGTNISGALHANGQSCCYSDIYGDGWTVRAYPTTQDDVGKTVTIFGIDNGNQPLRTNNLNGTWSDGWTDALVAPFVTLGTIANSPGGTYVRRIDRVIKEVTQGQVLLYAYNATTGELVDLAVYDPGETSPTYTRYSLHVNMPDIAGGCSCSSCSTVHSIVALVKLRFIPVKFDSDLVIIDNLDMLKEMVQSIKFREQGDLQTALAFEASAVREGNRELEDNFPDDTFSAENNIFGGYSFTNKCF